MTGLLWIQGPTVNGEPNPFYGMPLQGGDEKILGKVNPDWDASFTNYFRYKGFTFMAQLYYSKGGFISSGLTGLLRNYGAAKECEDRETPVVFPNTAKGYLDSNTGELVLEGDNDIEMLKGEDYYSTVLWGIEESKIFDKIAAQVQGAVNQLGYASTLVCQYFYQWVSLYLPMEGTWPSGPTIPTSIRNPVRLKGTGLVHLNMSPYPIPAPLEVDLN